MNSPNIIFRKAQNELWLKESYLLQLLPSLSADYLRVRARPTFKASVQKCFQKNTWLPDTGKSWRYSKIDGSFYYNYDCIPDKAPCMYQSQLPTRKQIIADNQEAEAAKESQPFETFIQPFLTEHYKEYLPAYGDCTPNQQANLAKAAASLKAILEFIAYQQIPLNKNDFFLTASDCIAKADIKYLPKNNRCFKRLVVDTIAANKEVTEAIKLPRAGNTNAVIHLSDPELKSWIIQMRMMGNNYTNSYIIRKLQFMCMASEKPMPSDRWIGMVMEEYNTKWLTGPTRFGKDGRQGQMFRGYIPLTNALYAGDCWQVDGTRVNLIDFKMGGKNVFLYIVAVKDVHSGDILGYSFDISENRWVVHNALKMAVEETGYLPYQIVFDKFPGHNTKEMESLFADMQNRGCKITFTPKATGKAKLERFFSTMQTVFMQNSAFYYGEGVQSRNKFAHRSKEQLKSMKAIAKKDGWDFDKAADEACRLIETFRSTKLSHYSRKFKTVEQTPAQLHEQSEKPHITALEPHQILYLFGLRTQRKFTGEGLLNIDIQGYPFSYRCADVDIVSRYEKVTICYDLEDLGTIHMYEISDRPLKKYLGTASEVSVQVYGPNGEWGKFQQQQAIIANMQQERERQLNLKMAAGSEFAVLQQGAISKGEYEAAETNYQLVQLGGDYEGDMNDADDIRNQY